MDTVGTYPIFGIEQQTFKGSLLYKEVTVTVELNDVEPTVMKALF